MRRRFGRVPSHAVALVALLAAACAAAARADDADRFRMDLTGAYKVDRFQSRAADSLGFSLLLSPVGDLKFDFCVLQMPMPGEKPSLHVFTEVATATRVVDTEGFVPSYVRDLPARRTLT